jgi:hypothetical protein
VVEELVVLMKVYNVESKAFNVESVLASVRSLSRVIVICICAQRVYVLSIALCYSTFINHFIKFV